MNKSADIVFVVAGKFDSTQAIFRAIRACGTRADCVKILHLDKTEVAMPRSERRDNIEIRRFHWPAPTRSVRMFVGLILYQLWLFRELLSLKPKVIQFLDFFSMWPVLLVAVTCRSKVIYDMRDPFADSWSFPWPIRSLVYALDWFGMSVCSAFVVPVPERLPYLGRWGRSARPVAIIRNTCADELSNLPFLSPVPQADSSRPAPIRIGFFGYLSPWRGAEMLVEIAARLNGQVELYVAGALRNLGDGPLTEQIYRQSNIRYLGWLGRPEALAAMRDVDLVALLYDPCLAVNRLAAPNKFYEAMMVGTPVIINRGVCLTGLVERERLGLVIDYGDTDKIAEVIKNTAPDDLRKEFRSRCRDYFLRHCSLEGELRKYEPFYYSLLSSYR